MQRTVRILRIALPLVFVGFIALLVVNWNRSAFRRTEDPSAPVTSTQRPQDNPQVEAVAFEDTQTIGGRVVSRIRAARVVGFESGWTTLENAQIIIYRPNNLTYEVICPQAQVHRDTKEAEAKGGVKVTSSDGIEIATAEIRFDGQRLTNDIPVQFKIDRWTGNAGGLDMNVENETLRLFKKIDATMTPAQPAEAPTNLKADEGVFRRRENDVTFTKDAQLARAADSLRADVIVGRFTQDRRTLVGFDGNGNARIVMSSNPSPGEDLGGRKEILCEGFFTEVGPDGQISAFNARSGAQPAHAILDGPPKRDIFARTFRVALANKAVSEIKADWQVVMKEYGEVTREINSEHVAVSFDPVAHKASSAYLEGAFRYSDPKTMASAFRASYDIPGDRILLTTDPGWQATVVSEGNIIKAKQIEFSPRGQTARATGEVIAQLVSKSGGPTADATNLFPSGKPVFVNADSLVMRQANKLATFSGNVRAWQEINTILAGEMQVQGAGNVITARGGVTTVLYNAAIEPGKKPAPVKSKSDQLIARKGERRLELLGNVTIEDETRVLKSEQSTFFFDANRKIERIEAENKVVVTERPTNRNGTGDKAIYQVARKMIYVSGSPATMTDPTGTLTGQQIVLDLNRNKVNVVSPTDQTKGSYKHTP
jgi:LPS export ABC transporter protein LptC